MRSVPWLTRYLFLPAALVAVLTLSPGDRAPDGAAPPGDVVVAVHPDLDLAATASRFAAAGRAVTPLHDLHALRVRPRHGESAPALIDIAYGVAGVRYAEPVRPLATADTPADPLYSRQSSYLNAIKAPQAWDIERGRPEIVVAVIDTGLDLTHPDISANLWFNPGEVPNNGADDDGNGCVDDVNGCAFVTDSSPGCSNVTNGFVRDDIGHGTFVAGVIAAASNDTGIVGVARNVRIMPVKVLDCYGSGDSVAAARGILYAARNGAAVINVSLGGLFDAGVVTDAVLTAWRDHGVLVVAAAGNDGAPGVAFPARIPEVLAVGAASTDPNRRAFFSSTGPEVDVVAVGEGVIGTLPRPRCFELLPCIGSEPYAIGDGTSFSTPQVSGLVALMLSRRRALSPDEITSIIKTTATPVPPGTVPDWAGAGRVDMLAALRAVDANVPSGDPCNVASVQDGESFTCTSGLQVRMLQMDAPGLGECGGDWAKAAAEFIFLTPGRTVYLRYDATRTDEAGRTLAAPVWRGNDGGDYNLSIVMVYVGLARAADVGAGNALYRDWALASQTWAATAQWNMWAPGKTFNGGC